MTQASQPYSLDLGKQCELPVLLAVPHAGRDYPEHVVGNMRDFEGSRLRLEDRHVDSLAQATGKEVDVPSLIAHTPRAVVDLNRSPEDMDWTMVRGGPTTGKQVRSLQNRYARGGLGLVPRRLPGLGEIWKQSIARAEVQQRIETIHRPYHAALGRALESIRDQWGAALLIDLHSMPPLKPKHPDARAAEFVVGDRFGASCEGYLADTALRFLGARGRPVAHNRPYAGGYVLDRHGSPRRGIHAMQLEICRSTYLDARLDEPSARLGSVAKLIGELVRVLAGEVMALGRDEQSALAAE